MTHVSTFLLPVALERGWIHHQPANINFPILFFFPKGKVWGQGACTCMHVTGVGGGRVEERSSHCKTAPSLVPGWALRTTRVCPPTPRRCLFSSCHLSSIHKTFFCSATIHFEELGPRSCPQVSHQPHSAPCLPPASFWKQTGVIIQ